MKRIILTLAMSMALGMTACGGGGSGTTTSSAGGDTGGTGDTTVSGLEIPQQMSLVSDSSASSSLSRLLRTAVANTGDYANDQAEVYVHDRSMEGLSFINELLCYVDQSHASEVGVVNAGPYTALIDAALCRRGEGNENDNTGQSSGQESDYELWVIESERADDSSPQTIRFWVADEEMGGEIRAEMVIESAASETNRFGIWTMNFTFVGGEFDGLMNGVVSVSQTDSGDIAIVMDMTEPGFSRDMTAVLSPDGESGAAHLETSEDSSFFSEEGSGEAGGSSTAESGGAYSESVDVAFDSDHFLSSFNDDEEVCRDRLNLIDTVYSYNLYNEDGSRVNLNTGFPLKKGDYYGWASYWGVWMQDETGQPVLADGDTVTRSDTDEEMTFDMAPGRLTRRTRHSQPINGILGQRFATWNNDLGQNIHVRLEAGSGNSVNVYNVGQEECSDDGCETVTLDTPVLLNYGPNEPISLWGENGNFDLVTNDSGLLTSDMEIPFYTTETVLPDDPALQGGLTLVCYSQCLKPGLSADDLNSDDPFLPLDYENPQEYVYTIDGDYVLQSSGQDIGIDIGAAVSESSMYSWGVQSGAMVTSDVDLEDYWEVWDQEITYAWETGSHEWNHHSGLIDANGDYIVYDQPINLIFENDDESNGEEYVGQFQLTYGGNGMLWGIPWVELSQDDGAYTRWVAAFTIPEGAEIHDLNGTAYYARQMVIERVMEEDDLSQCSDLTLGAELDVPDVTQETPSNGDNPCSDGTCSTLEELLD